jgi:hypothetical protein
MIDRKSVHAQSIRLLQSLLTAESGSSDEALLHAVAKWMDEYESSGAWSGAVERVRVRRQEVSP